jgi:hypothetical protein
VLITCAFRNYKRSSSAVIFGYLDVFCDHKMSKRSAARWITDALGRRGSWGIPWTVTQPDHIPARVSPRCDRHVRCPALPLGWRVVALGMIRVSRSTSEPVMTPS